MANKRCPKCDVVKPFEDFMLYKSGKRFGQARAYCKKCCVIMNKIAKKRDPSIYRRIEWPSKLKNNYGITVEDYNRILAEQGGACALCKSTTPQNGSRKYKRNVRIAFDVDHDHKTKKVRGLLCSRCNRLVGLANDDPNTARRLVEYLEKEN